MLFTEKEMTPLPTDKAENKIRDAPGIRQCTPLSYILKDLLEKVDSMHEEMGIF